MICNLEHPYQSLMQQQFKISMKLTDLKTLKKLNIGHQLLFVGGFIKKYKRKELGKDIFNHIQTNISFIIIWEIYFSKQIYFPKQIYFS